MSGLYGNTASKIAEKHGISPTTVKRAEKYVDAIEELKEVAPELNKQITARTSPKNYCCKNDEKSVLETG